MVTARTRLISACSETEILSKVKTLIATLIWMTYLVYRCINAKQHPWDMMNVTCSCALFNLSLLTTRKVQGPLLPSSLQPFKRMTPCWTGAANQSYKCHKMCYGTLIFFQVYAQLSLLGHSRIGWEPCWSFLVDHRWRDLQCIPLHSKYFTVVHVAYCRCWEDLV
jgi:hypothetical protein